MSTLRSKFVPLAICLAFGLVACGDDSSSTSSSDGNDATATPTTDDGGGDRYGSPETGSADVMLADSEFGQILVDGNGMTLYVFLSDSPDTPTCTGECAEEWPPMPADGDLTVGDGLDAALFTTVTGVSGPQLSFNGHPLYYFVTDTAPGDITGQNDDNFFVVGPDGNAITT